MSAKPLAQTALNERETEAPHLLKVVEAASTPAYNDPHALEGKKAKGSSLGSLKLNWLKQVTNDTGVTDAAFRIGHKIAEHINERELCAWPKLATIASLLGRSERSVRVGVHTLVHRQHLECSKRGSGNLNQYELLLNGLTIEERDQAEAKANAASKAALDKRKVGPSAHPVATSKAMSEFECLMAIFPPRKHEQDREAARISYELIVSKGTPANVIHAGAEAYRKFCDEEGHTGTDWVYTIDGWLDLRGWRGIDPDYLPQDEEAA